MWTCFLAKVTMVPWIHIGVTIRLSTLVPLPLVLHHLITKRLLVRWEYNKSFKAKRPRVDINLNLIIEPKKKYSKYNQKWTVAIVAVTVTIIHEVSKKQV